MHAQHLPAVRPRSTIARAGAALLALLVFVACTERQNSLEPTRAAAEPSAVIQPYNDYADVVAGGHHTCGVKLDGTFSCWGYEHNGVTISPAGLTEVTSLGAGSHHTCAVKTDSTVACWGVNGYGQTNVPAGLTGVVQVDGGREQTCALKSDGTVTCWGGPYFGPGYPPAGLTGVTQLSTGNQSCALKSDGTVTCWGSLYYPNGNRHVPAGLTGVKQVSVGSPSECALKNDGTIVCWGDNDYGQMSVPAGLTGVTHIATGARHTCAVKSDGTVVCWGGNDLGQLTVPAGLTGVTRLSADGAGNHTCALKSDGTAACWGSSSAGETAVQGDHFSPVAEFVAPSSAEGGESFTLALNNASTPGFTGAVTFSYAFHCGGPGQGYSPFTSSNTISCPLSQSGSRVVRAKVQDQDLDFSEYTATVLVVDHTPPVITPIIYGTLGANGWYTDYVFVEWEVTDYGSYARECDFGSVSADTQGEDVTCTSTSEGGTASKTLTFKLDATPPTLAPTVSPNPLLLNASATAMANASDATSGVAVSSCGTPVTSVLGAGTVTCSATDMAGNTATASVSYNVVYAFSGFQQPVDNAPTVNVVKAGSAVQVKFSLGGNQGLGIFAAGSPGSQQVSCNAGAPQDAIETTVSAGNSSLAYNTSSQQYAYTWKTDKSWAGTCRTFSIVLIDGTTHQANFKFN